MSLGLIALLLAGAGAGWLLVRLAGGGRADGGRNVTILKLVVWFGLAAALFAAKLFPLALMVLLAAGGVTAIEAWRDKRVSDEERAAPSRAPAAKVMSVEEAAAVLGLSPGADIDAVKAAHKKLISQIHPDKGGTDYLASKINEARDLLLRAAQVKTPEQ